MRKAVINKKIKAFKEVFPNWKQSQRTDSIYAKVNEVEVDKVVEYHARNLTKGVFHKFGTKETFKRKHTDVVYLISPMGKLMYRTGQGRMSWRNATLKHVREYNGWIKDLEAKTQEAPENSFLTTPTKRAKLQIKDVFFIGKKYEWMKDYPEFWYFKFFMSFTSLKEAKNFLGFTYISNQRFYGMFKDKPVDAFDDILKYRDNKNIVNLFNKLDKDSYHMFVDYMQMCEQEAMTPEIPKGYNKLRKIHDAVAEKQNKELLKYTSKECVIFPKYVHYERAWIKRGLKFKRLTDPYTLRLTGIRQKHCIGSYHSMIFNQAVYSFFYEGKEFNLAFDSESGNILQLRGYRNSSGPDKLYDLISKDVDLKHTIIRKTELPEHYPYTISKREISEIKHPTGVWAVEDVHGDIPF
jgi:hypothetical protein